MRVGCEVMEERREGGLVYKEADMPHHFDYSGYTVAIRSVLVCGNAPAKDAGRGECISSLVAVCSFPFHSSSFLFVKLLYPLSHYLISIWFE